MESLKKKPILGITGGIGSGKSTVATEFVKLGCGLVDADKIAHHLLEEGEVKEQIVSLFGADILDQQKRIDRKKLADIVFNDQKRLFLLNKILHPLVLSRCKELIGQYQKQNDIKAIVLDIPLLLEVEWDKKCDKIIFVERNKQLRSDSIKKNGFFDEKQIKDREKFQISLDKKAAIADNIINNNCDFSQLTRQIVKIFSCITGNN